MGTFVLEGIVAYEGVIGCEVGQCETGVVEEGANVDEVVCAFEFASACSVVITLHAACVCIVGFVCGKAAIGGVAAREKAGPKQAAKEVAGVLGLTVVFVAVFVVDDGGRCLLAIIEDDLAVYLIQVFKCDDV